MGFSYGTGIQRHTRIREVSVHAERRGRCRVCRKQMRCNHVFVATENPHHRGLDGHPLTVEEIEARLMARAAAWTPEFLHRRCRASRGESR